eukprot:4110719-Pyramimonas_sp.AAC.1
MIAGEFTVSLYPALLVTKRTPVRLAFKTTLLQKHVLCVVRPGRPPVDRPIGCAPRPPPWEELQDRLDGHPVADVRNDIMQEVDENKWGRPFRARWIPASKTRSSSPRCCFEG